MIKQYNHTNQWPFLLFTLAVVLALVLPAVLQHGMFMDGTQYAVVSKNLWEGKGSFWFPFLSQSWEKQGQMAFLEHPPLIYWLQSFFFTLFNGSYYSERVYSLFTLFISLFLIKNIWQFVFNKQHAFHFYFWVPIILWIITPSVFWAFNNNMQENTLTVFVLAAVLFALKAMTTKKYYFIYCLISGVCVFLATLCKGLPGLFPVITGFLFGVVFKSKNLKKGLLASVIISLIPILIYALLIYSNAHAKTSLTFYLNERLFFRIANTTQVDNRFVVLLWLLTDLVVPICFLGLLFIVYRIARAQHKPAMLLLDFEKKWFLLFLSLGLSGVIPLTFTHVQRAVYFVPALPFLAMAMGVLGLPLIINLVVKTNRVRLIIQWVAIVGLITVLCVSFLLNGKTRRDEAVLTEVHMLGKILPKNAVIGVPYSIYDDWDFQFYLLRYYNITLNPYPGVYKTKLLEKETLATDNNYQLQNITFKKYALYQRINEL